MNASTDSVSHHILSPITFLERDRHVYPQKTAIIYGDRRWSYDQFAQRVHRLASSLQVAGGQPGDRVAFLCPNIPPLLEAHFGVPMIGAVLVAINIRLAPPEIAYILNHCGAKFLFVDTELAATVRPVLEQLTTVETIINIEDITGYDPLGGLDYESFLQLGDPEPIPDATEAIADEMATISINYTSGTSGQPKGVEYAHRGAYLNALGEVLETNLRPESVYLWTLPMFHCNGWCFTWGVTAIGATHLCLRKFDPALVWQLVQTQGVSHLNGAPVVLIALFNHASCPQQLAHPLTVTTAGAPPSPTLIEKLSGIGAKMLHVYGLTEVYGPFTVAEYQSDWQDLSPAERSQRIARQGVPYIGAEGLRVVDETMQDVPADGKTMGEVVMRGNLVMKGYYADPVATEQAFAGGWFHSGDLGVMHADGYIELRDRQKDVIISGGENISSIEIEQCLYRHDAVLECAVVGIPDERWGETPKAFITLKPGAETTKETLQEFCRTQMAHFKCPIYIAFQTLPKTSTGKIQKYLLRDQEWQGHARRIQGA